MHDRLIESLTYWLDVMTMKYETAANVRPHENCGCAHCQALELLKRAKAVVEKKRRQTVRQNHPKLRTP